MLQHKTLSHSKYDMTYYNTLQHNTIATPARRSIVFSSSSRALGGQLPPLGAPSETGGITTILLLLLLLLIIIS